MARFSSGEVIGERLVVDFGGQHLSYEELLLLNAKIQTRNQHADSPLRSPVPGMPDTTTAAAGGHRAEAKVLGAVAHR